MIRSILTFPNRLLYKKSREVKELNDAVVRLVEDMLETMYQAPGIG
ncbi:MAG: peptide deformylase, partial [Aquificota bacterium]